MAERDTPTPEAAEPSDLDAYLEKHGHFRGARVMYELAESFGVELLSAERREIAIKVAIDRGIEDAVYGSKDYGKVHNAIATGVAYGGYWPQVLATEFHILLTSLEFEKAAHMKRLPEGYYRLKVSDQNMMNNANNSDVSSSYLFTLRRDALEALAGHRARFMAVDAVHLKVDESCGDETQQVARERFNRWLPTFYSMYEQLGSARKLKQLFPDVDKDSDRHDEWRALERQELGRTLKELCVTSEFETLATLAIHGLARVMRSIVRRQKMTNPA